MIDSVYRRIRHMADAGNLSQAQARMYIAELAVFARYHAQFLKLAAGTVASATARNSPASCAVTTWR